MTAIPQRALEIIQAACDANMATVADVMDGVRCPHVVRARKQAIREIHATGILSSSAIGRLLGIHHTSVLYLLKQSRRDG